MDKLIDDLCDRFEAAMRRGDFVRIEDYLNEIGGEDETEYRAKLLRELLEIEIELTAQQSTDSEQSISRSPLFRLRESLVGRFPDQRELIDSIVRRISKLRRIGDYEILAELGHGGMGIVYKAKQKLLNQTVAIKILSRSLLNDPQAVGRFRREMQLIGGLNHPNIVRALNAGESDGSHYLVMEFVDGVTLQGLGDGFNKNKEHAQGGRPKNDPLGGTTDGWSDSRYDNVPQTGRFPDQRVASEKKVSTLPIPAACEAIRQAALGLQHAHEFGLVHRDIKPANLMLDRQGTVKLLDLGLGKFLDEYRAPGDHDSLTMAGTTIGTIDYISPEQCENAGTVDIRSDLYSLGCTFYYLLAGHAPYSGSRYDTTRKKLMAHIVAEIPDLRKIVPDLPDTLNEILRKLLAKEPQERFQTPLELAEALEPFSDIDALLGLIDDVDISGIRRKSAGGLTGKISKTSHTLQTGALKKQGLLSLFDSEKNRFALLLSLFVLGGTVLLLSGIVFFRQPTGPLGQKQNVQNQESVKPEPPLPVPVSNVDQAQKSNIQTDLALLPGLNGSWWFDEMPWFLPTVRDLLLKKLDQATDLKQVLGDDPERYYDPNVPAVQAWLWSMAEKYKGEFSLTDWKLVSALKEYSDTFFDKDSYEVSYRQFLDNFVQDLPADQPYRAVVVHTHALLEHRLAVVHNDRELALTAQKRYDEALERYRQESTKRGEGPADENVSINSEEMQAAARSRKMEFLCLSDAARLEYLSSGNDARAMAKFNEILQQRETSERLGALYQAELRSAHGDLCAAAGQYDDSLFLRGMEQLDRSKAGSRIHPLRAQLSERYAWSLLDQWKVVEAEKQFIAALLIRGANLQESKNRNAIIYTLHNWHGLALTLRYLGNADRAADEYRKTLKAIDTELEKCSPSIAPTGSGTGTSSGLQRYQADLRQRAANTRERFADCSLYGGAASQTFSQGRVAEAAKLYEAAAELYDIEGQVRTMRSKQAIALLLMGDIEKAEQILGDLDEQKRQLLGNQVRSDLVRQVAGALLAYRKAAAVGDKADGPDPEEAKQPLRQFLRQFTLPTNPLSADAGRRETLELRIFCAEFLIDRALRRNDLESVRQDLPSLMQPIGDFMNRPESKPFLRRICDKIVRTEALLYEASRPTADQPGTRPLLPIVRLLQWNRFRETDVQSAATTSDDLPTLIVFFLTDDAADGLVICYPQDGRPGELYRLPLTRQMVKGGANRQGDAWKLDAELLRSIQAEKDAGRPVVVSWNDLACWARTEAALLDIDWPFGELPLR